eukprot:gene28562-37733_t
MFTAPSGAASWRTLVVALCLSAAPWSASQAIASIYTPKAFAFNNERLAAATAKTGRNVSVFVLVMIIADETDEA